MKEEWTRIKFHIYRKKTEKPLSKIINKKKKCHLFLVFYKKKQNNQRTYST